MDCNSCKDKQMERTSKRLWIAVAVLIVALIASNVGWALLMLTTR